MEDELFEISLEELRIREIEEIEEITGLAFDEALSAGKPKGKVMRAIAYVSKRRENPDFTLEDAGNLIIRFSPETAPDPTDAAGS